MLQQLDDASYLWSGTGERENRKCVHPHKHAESGSRNRKKFGSMIRFSCARDLAAMIGIDVCIYSMSFAWWMHQVQVYGTSDRFLTRLILPRLFSVPVSFDGFNRTALLSRMQAVHYCRRPYIIIFSLFSSLLSWSYLNERTRKEGEWTKDADPPSHQQRVCLLAHTLLQ